MPTISVIVPVYNVEPYLRRCVDSILAQTFTDFELILVDDGSPDNCGAICDEYAAQDERVRVIHQPNGGLSAARNAGIDWAFANSDSEWLSFIDSDDWVHPKYLEALYHGAMETGCKISICGFERTNGEEPKVDKTYLVSDVWDTEEFYCENNVNAMVAWGKLYKRELFAVIRYPVGKIHEDEFTTYKLLFLCEKLAVIDQPLYAYYQNPNGIMGAPWSPKRLMALDALEERCDFFRNAGNEQMLKWTERVCLNFIMHHKSELEKYSELDEHSKRQEIVLLRKRMRIHLLALRREMPFHGNEWYYEFAFPRLTWCYWMCKGICYHIRRRIHHAND